MQTAEIRQRFLDHFAGTGHTVVPSAPLLYDDPTLLFVGAGMVPFKPYFTGQETPPFARAVSVQKCVRTTDIEEVGKTTRHGTFFQMCGNFAFGDYFKAEAIEFAWELVTKPQTEGGYGFDEAVLYASVYHEDDEAIVLWKRIAGLSDDRIVRLGVKDNFWSMGIPGPCGPSSEILIDRGPRYGAERDWDAGDRYMEFWNLVFMQNVRGEGGVKEDYPILGELPAKNIDTGMGLERVAYLLQGKDNLYEIDEVFPVIERAVELSGRNYGNDPEDDVRFRIVADHVRSALMLMVDGVTPGNEGRGYVLRRLIRRAVRSMRLLGVDAPTLPELLPLSKDRMRHSYPELDTEWGRVSQIAYAEEQAFRQTLRTGTQIFDTAVVRARDSDGRLSGDSAFRLHDTYGFPIDLTLEMAAEKGVSVDADGFRRLMAAQRERAKTDSAQKKKAGHADTDAYREVAADLGTGVHFTGYDEVVTEATVRGIVSTDGAIPAASSGATVEVVLDRTPFYAEGGGQLADQGDIELADGTLLRVLDVQSPVRGLIVHQVQVVSGEVTMGALALARVEVERRRSISRSHTATHMVHKAFREALGETATQAGSENSPGRFRFDFSATSPVPQSVLQEIEARVNDLVLADLGVAAEIMTQEQARRSGAMALFGEKYGEQVRVVSVGDWARELCGGTHAGRSGQLGVIKLLGEGSIGSGVRRVEALVGSDAYRFLAREHLLVAQLSEALKARPEELPARVDDIVERLRVAEKEIERVRVQSLLSSAAGLAGDATDVSGVAYVGYRAPEGATAADVRRLALDIRRRLAPQRPGVVTVIGSVDGKPSVVVAVNEAGLRAGLSASDLVKVTARALGGSGGGKPDVAQGGGSDAASASEALRQTESALASAVGS